MRTRTTRHRQTPADAIAKKETGLCVSSFFENEAKAGVLASVFSEMMGFPLAKPRFWADTEKTQNGR